MNIHSTNSALWVVTYPTKRSVLEDICFKTTWKGLQRQFLGGLTDEQIHGIYTEDQEAYDAANDLLLPQYAS